YATPNYSISILATKAHVPIGTRRGTGAAPNGFYMESFIDELANIAGKDPYMYRRELILRNPADTLLGIGRIAQNQLAPVHVRILACDVRKLVDEAFHVKAIGGGAGAPACPDRHVSFRRENADAIVRGGV